MQSALAKTAAVLAEIVAKQAPVHPKMQLTMRNAVLSLTAQRFFPFNNNLCSSSPSVFSPSSSSSPSRFFSSSSSSSVSLFGRRVEGGLGGMRSSSLVLAYAASSSAVAPIAAPTSNSSLFYPPPSFYYSMPVRYIAIEDRRKFMDKVRLQVIGGTGGKGVISFDHVTSWKRKPAGGAGGRGGDIILEASHTMQDLHYQAFIVRGRNGRDAVGNKGSVGRDGKPKTILVPVGTIVREVQRVYMLSDEDGGADAFEEDYGVDDGRGGERIDDVGDADGDESRIDRNTGSSSFSELRRRGTRPVAENDADVADGNATSEGRTRGRNRGKSSSSNSSTTARSSTSSSSSSEISESMHVIPAAPDQPLDKLRSRRAEGKDLFISDAAEDGHNYHKNKRNNSNKRRGNLGSVGPVVSSSSSSSSSAKRAEGIIRVNKSGLAFRETSSLITDLDSPGQRVLVARGGSPGIGNRGSELSYSEQRTEELKPHISGARGEVRFLELELKSIADVGLVGFPNAGKSSFLASVSKARPKIAEYPFTTLHPHVGVVHFTDGNTVTIADIPGLIEGAHVDRGLGHEFLRHIERTRALAYVIDTSPSNPDPAGDLRSLQAELRLYHPNLPLRPSLVIANKTDIQGSSVGVQKLRASTLLPVLEASALAKTGVGPIVESLRWLLTAADRERKKASAAMEATLLNTVVVSAAEEEEGEREKINAVAAAGVAAEEEEEEEEEVDEDEDEDDEDGEKAHKKEEEEDEEKEKDDEE